jgi:hypothetical protein
VIKTFGKVHFLKTVASVEAKAPDASHRTWYFYFFDFRAFRKRVFFQFRNVPGKSDFAFKCRAPVEAPGSYVL